MKIALAGQPYSGKTTVSKGLQKRLNPSANVHFISEVATRLLCENHLICQSATFQQDIFDIQRAEEEEYSNSIIISDRGLLDYLVYCSDEAIEKSHIFDIMSLEQFYDNYDLVLFFEKNPEHQRSTADTIRIEKNDTEIEFLSRRTHDVWSKHRNILYISHFSTADEKIDYVANIINDYCKEKLFV